MGGPPLFSCKFGEGQEFFNLQKIRLLYVSLIFWGGWDVRGAVTLKMYSNVKYKRKPVSERWRSFFFFFASVFKERVKQVGEGHDILHGILGRVALFFSYGKGGSLFF
jgi:hypothetical protein